jgi:dienelactone hydrolase
MLKLLQTVVPDYLHGDAIPADAMGPGVSDRIFSCAFSLTSLQKNFDIGAWFGNNHGQEGTRPILDAVIKALKEQGITAFGATGYCFGGRYAVDLALENITKAIVISHPSLLEVPGDFEKLKAQSNNPILINSCEEDGMFPPEKQKITDELLGNGQYKPGYVREYFPGCSHGFAVRGDLVRSRTYLYHPIEAQLTFRRASPR